MSRWVAEKLLVMLAETQDCVQIGQLAEACDRSHKNVSGAMAILIKAGLAEALRPGCWRITEAGRGAVASDGQVRSGPQGPMDKIKIVRSSLRARVWKALRTLRKATIPELLTMAARGDERNATNNTHTYLAALQKGGYVTPLAKRVPGTSPNSTGFIRWVLIRDSGPFAPVWRQKAGVVYDPNTKEEHHVR